MNHYQPRLEKIWKYMERDGVTVAMFENTEGKRDQTVRWLTGHPGDALLFLSLNHKTLLVPWDVNLAKVYATADALIAYGEFDRQPLWAIQGAAAYLNIPAGSKIEIPPVTPYPVFLDYIEELSDFDILCRERCIISMARELRAIKDAREITIYRKAAAVTNAVIDLLEKKVRAGRIKTEADAALLIEVEARKRGCEGTGFETLAAGPARSFGIHAFPPWTGAAFAGPGLSILDFGLRLDGYTTDVTLTFVREPNAGQEELIGLVEEAAAFAMSQSIPGMAAADIAAGVEELFDKSKRHMPHALGHGIGLDEHEYPTIRNRADNGWMLVPGMVFTLEPGLYDPVLGGCRLENDILMTETGAEMLTNARIIRL
jgi:Xaa-Pro dipeptidase